MRHASLGTCGPSAIPQPWRKLGRQASYANPGRLIQPDHCPSPWLIGSLARACLLSGFRGESQSRKIWVLGSGRRLSAPGPSSERKQAEVMPDACGPAIRPAKGLLIVAARNSIAIGLSDG